MKRFLALLFIAIALPSLAHSWHRHGYIPTCSLPTGVCNASWPAAAVWNLQNNIGNGVGIPTGTVLKEPAQAWFIGTISGTTLTVSPLYSCPYVSAQLANGMYVYGSGVTPGTKITSNGSGTSVCGGHASQGQDLNTWTVNNSQTVAATAMAAGPDNLPTASANCGMPSISNYGQLIFGNPGASGCVLNGWDFNGATLSWNGTFSSGGNNNPLTIENSAINFTGNAGNPTGPSIQDAIYTVGLNNVSVLNNTLDLSTSVGAGNSFGIVISGGLNSTVVAQGNYVKNAPANGIDLNGYATYSGNFIDKNGCSNGAHPDMSTYYGFFNYNAGTIIVSSPQTSNSITITGGTATPVAGNWVTNSGSSVIRDGSGNALTVTSFSGSTVVFSGSATFAAGTYYIYNNVTGSNSTPNYTYSQNLFNFANCGSYTATGSWTTGATSVTITGMTAADLLRYDPSADMFLVDMTTHQMVAQISSINTGTGVISLKQAVTGNSTYTNYAASASSGANDLVLVAGGAIASSGWSAGATTVTLDYCGYNLYQTGPNYDAPIWQAVPGSTAMVDQHIAAGGCSNSTTMTMFPGTPTMPSTRASGTVIMNFVSEVASMRPLTNSTSAIQNALVQYNITYGADPTTFWNGASGQFSPGYQGAGVSNTGVVVTDNLWSVPTWCAAGSSGIAGTPVVTTQSDNLRVDTGGSTNPC